MISLQGSLRTCKPDTSWAEKLRSDRFENPDLMMCPTWNGRDLVGRPVSENSFYTKSAGCNSPTDRVYVENSLRPQYMESTTTDAYGFRSDIYNGNKFPLCKAPEIPQVNNKNSLTLPPGICHFYPYDWDTPILYNRAIYSRVSQFFQHQTKAYEMLNSSGFG